VSFAWKSVRIFASFLTRRGMFFVANAYAARGASRFADVPLYRMQPVATVGDVSDAEVLTSWN
jgi:hypothetical protein